MVQQRAVAAVMTGGGWTDPTHPSRPGNTAVTIPLTVTSLPAIGVVKPEPWTAEIGVLVSVQSAAPKVGADVPEAVDVGPDVGARVSIEVGAGAKVREGSGVAVGLQVAAPAVSRREDVAVDSGQRLLLANPG